MWEVQKYVQKPELKRKRPLGRHRRRWENNIKVDVKERGSDDGHRIRLVQLGKVAGFCEHGNEPDGFIKWGIS